MHVSLKLVSNVAAYPDYAIVGMVDMQTGSVEMQAEPLNPDAESYAISGSINLRTGDISIVALADHPGATIYTITGSFDPRSGNLPYVCAKPGSFHRPKYSRAKAGRLSPRRCQHNNHHLLFGLLTNRRNCANTGA